MPSGMITPESVWIARRVCSSLRFSAASALLGYLPVAVGWPNFSRKMSQNLTPLRLKKTGQ